MDGNHEDLLAREVNKRLPIRGGQEANDPDIAEAILHYTEAYEKRTLIQHQWLGRFYRLGFWVLRGVGALIVLQSGIDIDHILNRRQVPTSGPVPAAPPRDFSNSP